MNSARFCTYIHLRPNGALFYVGKGDQGRAYQLRRSRNAHHQNIVNKYGVLNIGVCIIKRGLTEQEAFEHEIEAIDCLRDFGYELTNATLGGEGFRGGRHTAEFREKVRVQSKGNKYRVGKKDTAATRALKSAVLMGNKRRLGTRMPDYQREEKRHLLLTRNPMSSEKVRARHKARMNDPEVRGKRSLSMKRAWAEGRKKCIS